MCYELNSIIESIRVLGEINQFYSQSFDKEESKEPLGQHAIGGNMGEDANDVSKPI